MNHDFGLSNEEQGAVRIDDDSFHLPLNVPRRVCGMLETSLDGIHEFWSTRDMFTDKNISLPHTHDADYGKKHEWTGEQVMDSVEIGMFAPSQTLTHEFQHISVALTPRIVIENNSCPAHIVDQCHLEEHSLDIDMVSITPNANVNQTSQDNRIQIQHTIDRGHSTWSNTNVPIVILVNQNVKKVSSLKNQCILSKGSAHELYDATKSMNVSNKIQPDETSKGTDINKS